MSGAWEELRERGRLGPTGVALLYQTVRQVVALRNLPAPDGQERWRADQLVEAAHDVLADRNGPERLVSLAGRSHDEESFRAQLFTLVSNDLASRNRMTERGRLHQRVRSVLEQMPDVERQAGRVRLGPPNAAGAGAERRFDELVAACATVPVVVPAWDPLSERRAPLADRDSFERMIAATLSAAGDWLTLGELTAVLAVRLGVHDAPVHQDRDGWERIAPVSYTDPAAQVGAMDAAARLLEQLSAQEQLVLPHLDGSTSEMAQATGLGRTTAYKAAGKARFKVARALAGDLDAAATLAAAVERVRARWELLPSQEDV